jgi:hypothetical protein
MARAIWSGVLTFGLVSVPVELYSATEAHGPVFHQFEKGTAAVRWLAPSSRVPTAWLIGVMRLIGGIPVPQINRRARIHHVNPLLPRC